MAMKAHLTIRSGITEIDDRCYKLEKCKAQLSGAALEEITKAQHALRKAQVHLYEAAEHLLRKEGGQNEEA